MPWDPANANANLSFSNNNLNVTCNAAATNGFCVRSVLSYAGGKYYLETSFTSSVIGGVGPGIVLSAFPITTDVAMGGDLNSLIYVSAGNVVINGLTIGTAASYASGDTISMAVDRTANLIWFRVNAGNWNNSVTANPATGAGGFSLSTLNSGAIFASLDFSTSGDADTSNFGLSAFAQTVPSGFFPWDPTLGWLVSQSDRPVTRQAFIETIVARPPRVPAAGVPISGMSWFEPPDDLPRRPPWREQPGFIQQPIAAAAVAVPQGWFVIPTELQRGKQFSEQPAAISLTPATLPVPIRGMGWFAPADDLPQIKHRKPAFELPQAAVLLPFPIVGMAWFQPPDPLPRKPLWQEQIWAASLTPATLPVPVSGMGWFAPPDPLPRKPLWQEQTWAASLTPATLPVGVAGMPWMTVTDVAPRKPVPPPDAFGFVPVPPAPPVGISGMAWMMTSELDVITRAKFWQTSQPPAWSPRTIIQQTVRASDWIVRARRRGRR